MEEEISEVSVSELTGKDERLKLTMKGTVELVLVEKRYLGISARKY